MTLTRFAFHLTLREIPLVYGMKCVLHVFISFTVLKHINLFSLSFYRSLFVSLFLCVFCCDLRLEIQQTPLLFSCVVFFLILFIHFLFTQ